MSRPRPTALAAALGLACALAGCAPRLAPLYRDYRAPSDSLAPRLTRALAASGWALGPAPAPGSFATAPREAGSFGLYRMRLSLQFVPLGDTHVRVLFDPVRRFTWGSRTHVPYLPGGLQRRFIPDLDRALRAAGFTPVLSGPMRDRQRDRTR